MAKYEKVNNYWVYSIKIPSINKYYIGVSKLQCCQRWQKSRYQSGSLKEYLQEWQDMEKKVLIDGLNREQSYLYEGKIIEALSKNDLCINTNRSGLIQANDINAYHREFYQNNHEYHENQKQRCKQWRLDNPEYYKQWQKDNKEKWNEYMKQYQKEYRLKKKLEQQNQQLNLFS